MGGLLTHLSVAVIGFCIGTCIFKNWKYGLGFFIGQVIPDMIDFGIIGLFTWEFNPAVIMTNKWFGFLMRVGHTWWHWIIFGVMIFLIIFILYKFKKLSKEKFKIWFITEVMFLAGVFVHLLIDKFVIERSYWI